MARKKSGAAPPAARPTTDPNALHPLAEAFFSLFTGLPRAHGCYSLLSPKAAEAGKKHQGNAITKREPPTAHLWSEHLQGRYGIGIVPIRDDGTVRWGAIDVDQYKDTDIQHIAQEAERMGLPLIMCRTKSGGIHAFLFCSEDVSADLVRTKLLEWAVALGFAGSEVFPKQTRLASNKDFGNWINMPYYAGMEGGRYAVMPDGDRLQADQFLEVAAAVAVTAEQLAELNPPPDHTLGDILDEAPPCLVTLAKKGLPEGTRNAGLFAFGVYLKKRYGDDWQQHFDDINQKFLSPPLGHREVAQIANNLSKKAYEYRCNEQPMVGCCNRQICLKRKYGVAGGDDDPGVVFGPLVKLNTAPPTWYWDVNGARIECTTADLKEQGRFHSKCIEVLNIWPVMIRPKAWEKLVRERLASVEVHDVPAEATPEGQLWTMLEQYCTGRVQAASREELALKKPWTNDGRTYFNAMDFRRWCEQRRFHVAPKELWNWLRKRGAQHHFFAIKGKGINCWSVEAFAEQTDAFAVPEVPTDDTSAEESM